MKNLMLLKCLGTGFCAILFLFPLSLNAQQEDSAGYYNSSGKKLWQERSFAEALHAFDNARKFDPANEEAIYGQMNMNFRLGRIDEGLQVIEEWTVLHPENPEAWQTMADYFSMVGKTDEALGAVDKLIALQPDSASNWSLKATMMLEADRPQEALEASDKAIALDPGDPEAWYIKSYALANLGQYPEALINSNLAIEVFPDEIESYYTRACIYSKKGDKANALADLQKAIEMDPGFKQRAQADADFKRLYLDEEFQKLTGMSADAGMEAALADSVCRIMEKEYNKKEYNTKISGSWIADRAYVHGQNLLGDRKFYFTFRPDGTMEIKEPERNWSSAGTWNIGEKENSMEWIMPDKNNSFKGKYDFLGKALIISGQGFIGEYENVCLRLKLE